MVKTFLTLTAPLLCAVSPLQSETPKLIVVVSVDQLRYDYLVRFKEHFGENGWKYFFRNGANFVNASFKHAINTTGPGHAALLSGTYGSTNGIIANDWYDRDRGGWMYCVEDRSVSLVGSKGEGRSPRNFIGSTFGDELLLRYGFAAKVLSVSNKDRAAILMGGKLASGVYWMKDSVFVTSTYYAADLPEWVRQFNHSGIIDAYFKKVWNKLLPPSAYRWLDEDDAPYEEDKDGVGRKFPHIITGKDSTRRTPSYYAALARSPFSAEILSAFAQRAIEAEQLGKRGVTDMLCVSFSGMDIVGHAFGPHSHEVMDMVVRLDAIIADFLSFLDRHVGLRSCVLVLMADHGVAPIPEYIKRTMPSADVGRVPVDSLKAFCTRALTRRFGEPQHDMPWIDAIVANNIYLNREVSSQPTMPPLDLVASTLADSLRTHAAIAAAYSRRELSSASASNVLAAKMQRSFHPLRSGDVMYALKPYWTEGTDQYGASHGEPYEYDAHVPLVFVGDGIRRGTFAVEASPVDIAPTLSALLGIEFPPGREGRVLIEALK